MSERINTRKGHRGQEAMGEHDFDGVKDLSTSDASLSETIPQQHDDLTDETVDSSSEVAVVDTRRDVVYAPFNYSSPPKNDGIIEDADIINDPTSAPDTAHTPENIDSTVNSVEASRRPRGPDFGSPAWKRLLGDLVERTHRDAAPLTNTTELNNGTIHTSETPAETGGIHSDEDLFPPPEETPETESKWNREAMKKLGNIALLALDIITDDWHPGDRRLAVTAATLRGAVNAIALKGTPQRRAAELTITTLSKKTKEFGKFVRETVRGPKTTNRITRETIIRHGGVVPNETVLAQLNEQLDHQVGARLLEQLTDEQLDMLQRMQDENKSQAEIALWFKNSAPNLQTIVQEETTDILTKAKENWLANQQSQAAA